MADDPINQQQFEEDVLAAAAANDGESYSNIGATDGNFEMPSVEEVWKIIEQMEGISDEERANLRESLFNPKEGAAGDFMQRYAGQSMMGHTKWEYMTFTVMIAIIFLVFVLLDIGFDEIN